MGRGSAGAALYTIKVLDRARPGQWSNLIAGIDWCIDAQDIRILYMSLGGPRRTRRTEADVRPRLGKGSLLVAAAGNEGGPVSTRQLGSVVAVSALDGAGNDRRHSPPRPRVEVIVSRCGCALTVPAVGTAPIGYQHGQPRVAGARPSPGLAPLADDISIGRLLAGGPPMGRIGARRKRV